MLFKKKATSTHKKPKEKKVTDKAVKDPNQGQTGQTPPDPFKRIQETQAAAQEPTRKVDKGEVKPPVAKPESLQEKKPEEMTGAEEEAMMVSGGVLPKEQAEKERKEQEKLAGTGPAPQAPGTPQKQP